VQNILVTGFEVLTAVVMKSTTFWDITPCRPLKFNRRFKGTYYVCFPPAFTLVSCSAYYSTLKMEAICSSETSVAIQRITRPYIPEDSTLYVSDAFCVSNAQRDLMMLVSQFQLTAYWTHQTLTPSMT
jgi:hypothetical protein